MRNTLFVILITFTFFFFFFSNVSPNAVELEVDFSWEEMQRCGMGIPEIRIKEVPNSTKHFIIRMYDHAYHWDHGKVKVAYRGSNIISKNHLEKIESPCPPDTPGRYEVTVKAIDNNGVVIGVGSKERYFPEK